MSMAERMKERRKIAGVPAVAFADILLGLVLALLSITIWKPDMLGTFELTLKFLIPATAIALFARAFGSGRPD